jgi:hypothetical protein
VLHRSLADRTGKLGEQAILRLAIAAAGEASSGTETEHGGKHHGLSPVIGPASPRDLGFDPIAGGPAMVLSVLRWQRDGSIGAEK